MNEVPHDAGSRESPIMFDLVSYVCMRVCVCVCVCACMCVCVCAYSCLCLYTLYT